MKIQSTTNNKQHIKKSQKKQTSATSFDSMLNAAQAETEQPIKHDIHQQPQPSVNPQADLEAQVQALEDTLSKLDDEQHDPEHIQQNITDLRQALQQSELHPQALEDADTLLAVEAKRLEGLSRKTP